MTGLCVMFTPPQCQLVKLGICVEFWDTKLLKKSNFDTPKGVPIKARVPSKICTGSDYGN